MANLFSQYTSGTQFTAGALAGSSLGTSGLNPIVDRLNSVAPSDNLLSGTALVINASGNSTFPKTSYYSTRMSSFITVQGGIDVTSSKITSNTDDTTIAGVINLPHGAVVGSVTCYGDYYSSSYASGPAFQLIGRAYDGTNGNFYASGMMSIAGSINTSVSLLDTVNNSTRGMMLSISNFHSGVELYDTIIEYTKN